MSSQRKRTRRKGNVLVLSVILMAAMFAFLAFAVDVGYLSVVRSELQRTADAAAIAAAWELLDEEALTGGDSSQFMEDDARTLAAQYATLNTVTGDGMGLAQQDVVVGYLADPFDPTAEIDLNSQYSPNAVRVSVRKTSDQNGSVPFFFARVLGYDDTAMQAQATAVLLKNFIGWSSSTSGDNVELLPFALDLETWQDLLAGNGDDNWTWNVELQEVQSGADGILEANLFPQDTGSPGNRGTVDIGSNNNSTADIARQILEGISAEDLAYHGGELKLDANGELELNGDTGISAGVKDELTSIKGQPRIIPIFSQVTGPGNNAQYTIVQFAGIRIMDVKLTGKMSGKRVIVQPANVVTLGGIPATGEQTSNFIYSPVWLAR